MAGEDGLFDRLSGAAYECVREPPVAEKREDQLPDASGRFRVMGALGTGSAIDGWRESMHDKCMAVKTITIDLEAYEALARHKRKGDSFSRVIKEHFGRRRTGRDLAALAATLRLSEDTLESVEKLVRGRRRSRARAPKL